MSYCATCWTAREGASSVSLTSQQEQHAIDQPLAIHPCANVSYFIKVQHILHNIVHKLVGINHQNIPEGPSDF